MTFTQVFGGTTIYPSGVSYRAVALSADQTLAWPVETATSANVVAQIMDVTPSVGSLSIIMPPANEVSVGETTLFFNAGSFAFTVKDNGGNTIVSIAAGLSYQVYLIGNSTVNGTWRSTQYSAGTSSATAGSLVGYGIKAISTTLNQKLNVTSLNTPPVGGIGDADRASAFVWTGGAGTIDLPSTSSVGNDWFFQIRNGGTGSIVLEPVGSELINGTANLTFNPGDSAIIICDGTSFFTIGFGQAAAFAFDYVSIDLSPPAVTSPYTLAGNNLNRIAYQFGGTLTGNMEVYIPATIQQYWISNDTGGTGTLTVKVQGQTGVEIPRGARAICYCNGTDLIDADTASIAFPLTILQGGTGATTANGALVNLGGTSVGRAVFTASTAADGRVALAAAASGANSDITSLTGLTTPLSAPQGGTGQSSYAVGDILYASTTTALSKLADVATGNALISGGVGVAPSWGKIGLTTHVSGTLPTANGGTNLTSFTSGGAVYATSTSVLTTGTLPATAGGTGQASYAVGDLLYASTTTALSKLADVATGNALISGGVGVAPSYGKIGLTTHVSGTLPIANGGTNATTAAAALTSLGAAASGVNTDITALDQDVIVTATGTIAANTIGYRGIPQNSQTASYTLALSDAGKHISITTGGVVVPANGTVAFPVGSAISVYNNSASSQTISITTDTMYLAGTATTGSRTLAQRGLATILKVASTTWVISGGGLT